MIMSFFSHDWILATSSMLPAVSAASRIFSSVVFCSAKLIGFVLCLAFSLTIVSTSLSVITCFFILSSSFCFFSISPTVGRPLLRPCFFQKSNSLKIILFSIYIFCCKTNVSDQSLFEMKHILNARSEFPILRRRVLFVWIFVAFGSPGSERYYHEFAQDFRYLVYTFSSFLQCPLFQRFDILRQIHPRDQLKRGHMFRQL